MSCISIRPEELGTKEHLNEGERGEWKSWLKTQHSKYEEHGIQSHQFMADRWGKCANHNRFYFLGSEITAYGECSHEIKRCLLTERNTVTDLDCLLKRHHFSDKSPFSQSYGFSSGHVWMWELDHKESWAPKNRRFQTVALEKTLERPLDCKEIKSVNQNIQEINLNIHWKDWCWSWSSNILAACYEDLTHWKRLCCWERLKAGGEGADRGWDH